MNTRTRLVSLLALLAMAFPSQAVFARMTATNYVPAFSSWSRYGSPTVNTESVQLSGGSSQWVYTDVEASRVGGSYLVIASHANKSDRRTIDAATRRTSGNPYVYAYLMNSNKRINKYVTGTTTTSSSRNEADRVVYSIVPVESGTSTIRVFLMQSSVKDVSNVGADVTFIRPVLLSTNSWASAQSLVNAYADGTLDLIQDSGTSNSGTDVSVNRPVCAPTGSSTVVRYQPGTTYNANTTLRYNITGLLDRNQTYTLSARVRYVRNNASATTANVLAGYELGEGNNAYVRESQQTAVGSDWMCATLTFKNRGFATTKQNALIQFSNLANGSSIYVDEVAISR